MHFSEKVLYMNRNQVCIKTSKNKSQIKNSNIETFLILDHRNINFSLLCGCNALIRVIQSRTINRSRTPYRLLHDGEQWEGVAKSKWLEREDGGGEGDDNQVCDPGQQEQG